MRAFRELALSLAALSLPALAQAPAAPADAATTAPQATLPNLDPAEWFDGKMGGTFGAKTVTAFPKSNRLAVAGFRVVFVTRNEVRAITRASYLPGRETGAAKAKMVVELQGVDAAALQGIADRAYGRFLDQLRAAGREIVDLAPFKEQVAAFKTSPVPQPVDAGLQKGQAFAPGGTPLWWQVGEAWGDAGLGQANMRAFNRLSEAAKAIVIAPVVVVDFAHMQSSGNRSGLLARRAEVGAVLAMSVPTFSTRVVRAEETRYGGIVFKGDDGALALTRPLDTDLAFADLEKGEEKKSTVLSLFGGDHKASRTASVARTNGPAYAAAAEAVLAQATGAFAKLLAAHPSK
jgi:hypothetical protein